LRAQPDAENRRSYHRGRDQTRGIVHTLLRRDYRARRLAMSRTLKRALYSDQRARSSVRLQPKREQDVAGKDSAVV
jgi:hypothetical protein